MLNINTLLLILISLQNATALRELLQIKSERVEHLKIGTETYQIVYPAQRYSKGWLWNFPYANDEFCTVQRKALDKGLYIQLTNTQKYTQSSLLKLLNDYNRVFKP